MFASYVTVPERNRGLDQLALALPTAEIQGLGVLTLISGVVMGPFPFPLPFPTRNPVLGRMHQACAMFGRYSCGHGRGLESVRYRKTD